MLNYMIRPGLAVGLVALGTSALANITGWSNTVEVQSTHTYFQDISSTTNSFSHGWVGTFASVGDAGTATSPLSDTIADSSMYTYGYSWASLGSYTPSKLLLTGELKSVSEADMSATDWEFKATNTAWESLDFSLDAPGFLSVTMDPRLYGSGTYYSQAEIIIDGTDYSSSKATLLAAGSHNVQVWSLAQGDAGGYTFSGNSYVDGSQGFAATINPFGISISGAVPEPATLVGLAIGALALLRRKRGAR